MVKVYPRGITSAFGTAKERHRGIVKQWGVGPGACRAALASYTRLQRQIHPLQML